MLAGGGLPTQGGVPTSVYITIALDDLIAGQGAGTTEDGQRMSLATVQRRLLVP